MTGAHSSRCIDQLLLLELDQELAYFLTRACVAINHGTQQGAQMHPQRKCQHRFGVARQRTDELIELVDALLERRVFATCCRVQHCRPPGAYGANDSA
jgi:hypothetical protein